MPAFIFKPVKVTTFRVVLPRMLLSGPISRRKELAPAIAEQVAAAERAMSLLTKDVERFKAHFLQNAPFAAPGGAKDLSPGTANAAFAALDALQLGATTTTSYSCLEELQRRIECEHERCQLLGVSTSVPEGLLKQCQTELGMLRQLWEEGAAIEDALLAWAAQEWASVDVDGVAEECKTKAKSLKALPKAVRAYPAYTTMEDQLKGLTTVLPLLKDLANPAMRSRHWAALARVLGTSLPSDTSSLTLGTLLALKLDRCADTCAEVVDAAKKEAVVERALSKMAATWQGLSLSFKPIPGRHDGLTLLYVDDAITEALESDGLALQNMAASKVVAANSEFKASVATWQQRLAAVDTVLGLWTDAQRKWLALEAIFCGSADIRAQMPQETVAFNDANGSFQEVLRAGPAIPSVLAACAVPGRKEQLEAILRSLELRERALQDYMETKRMAFPRFYFVAPADLLDILAKGADPHAVER